MDKHEPLTTVNTQVQFGLQFTDPDGDWTPYGSGSEDAITEAVRDLRHKHPQVKWRVVRRILTEEVLDL